MWSSARRGRGERRQRLLDPGFVRRKDNGFATRVDMTNAVTRDDAVQMNNAGGGAHTTVTKILAEAFCIAVIDGLLYLWQPGIISPGR